MMKDPIKIYNSLSRNKDVFKPLNPPFVGMYVCGPTVYGDAHLGHARPAITFDIVYRYLKYRGYKVRYVRNITDVGHLEHDADEGEDKIGKKARIEQLEPMEVVQKYTLGYHNNMQALNCLPPDIEPRASGHIIEQISLIQKIIDHGYGYIVNGSVYFDIEKYSRKNHYGKLSGRQIDELIDTTRELENQTEKRHFHDFALWKKASEQHIMKWPSPWSEGFPGWHLECSAMSTKYLGQTFDIHGGGMDLLFPHHECEIAQSVAGYDSEPVQYWMHNNMITINGKKMGKSLGNFITIDELFSGENNVLNQAYNPMTLRFFILQAHYRSTLDFSNAALKAAEKGYKRLMAGIKMLGSLPVKSASTIDIHQIKNKILNALNDDFNTPIVMAELFDLIKLFQKIAEGTDTINKNDYEQLNQFINEVVFEILGFCEQNEQTNSNQLVHKIMDVIIELRAEARANKNFELSDSIREKLGKINIVMKDAKDGTTWNVQD